jgi:hypothetical protein
VEKSVADRAILCLFLLSFGLCGAPADPISDNERILALSATLALQSQLLEKARAANSDLYSTLKSFVCREEIQRFKGGLSGSDGRPIDRVSANLSFENGTERYFDILQNNRNRPSLSAIEGAWSEGEFGTLLQQTSKLLETEAVTFVAAETLDGHPTSIYRFSVSADKSPWDLEVSPNHYRIPFTTDVWISAETGEIVKIARKSLAMPSETRISEIDWEVSLGTVDLNGQKWLLPALAEYSVSYTESNRREWNRMVFSDYRHYGSESVLRFNGF